MENHYPDLNNADTLIVFDTNVWLDFYTYAPKATREICDALFRLKHKLWIPSQVFYEYNAALYAHGIDVQRRRKMKRRKLK